jgi:hypothetical protein
MLRLALLLLWFEMKGFLNKSDLIDRCQEECRPRSDGLGMQAGAGQPARLPGPPAKTDLVDTAGACLS